MVEDLSGQLVGIEVKASTTVRREDFRGLKKLGLAGGEDFRLGVILNDGDRVLPIPPSLSWTRNRGTDPNGVPSLILWFGQARAGDAVTPT